MQRALRRRMARLALGCAVIVGLCGCAADAGALDVPPDSSDTPEFAQPLSTDEATDGTNDFCALLPPDPPCSLACDPDALSDFVPAGTCAAFLCPLSDGTQFAVHACHPV